MEHGAERSEGSMRREGSMHDSRPEHQQIILFGTEWYHGYDSRIYIHIYYLLLLSVLCCSAVSQCHGGWITSWVSLLYYVLRYCCTSSTGLWVGRSVRSCRVLLSCVHPVSWFFYFFFFFLSLCRPRAGIVQRTTS